MFDTFVQSPEDRTRQPEAKTRQPEAEASSCPMATCPMGQLEASASGERNPRWIQRWIQRRERLPEAARLLAGPWQNIAMAWREAEASGERFCQTTQSRQ